MQSDIVRQPPQNQEGYDEGVQATNQRPVQPQTIVDVVNNPDAQQVPTSAQNQATQPTDAPENTKKAEEERPEASKPAEISHKSTKPIGIIVAAVLACTALSGGAIYLGIQSSNKDSQVATQNQPVQNTAAPEVDTAKEIDTALQESNSLEDTGQDISNDLSDASLGL